MEGCRNASPPSPPPNVGKYFYITNRLCIVFSDLCTTYHLSCTNSKSTNGSVELEGCRNGCPCPLNVRRHFYNKNRLCIISSDLCTTAHRLCTTLSQQIGVSSWMAVEMSASPPPPALNVRRYFYDTNLLCIICACLCTIPRTVIAKSSFTEQLGSSNRFPLQVEGYVQR